MKSAGSPLRPVMERAARASTRPGMACAGSVSGVSTNPGTMVLLHTPCGDHASACERERPVIAALLTPYAPLSPNALIDCCEPTLMMRPQPRAAMRGPKCWPSRYGAVMLTRMVVS